MNIIRNLTNRLYIRFLCVFGITSSVLVLLVGVVFFRLYSNNVIESFEEQLQTDANKIANNIEEYVLNDEHNRFIEYTEAVQALLDSQKVDMWIMPNYQSENRLKSRYANTMIAYRKLSKGMKQVMKKVYREGEICGNNGYDEIYDEDIIRAGAPINDAGGNVIGGVLLNGMVSARIEAINDVKGIVVFSLIIAWLVALIISLFMSSMLSRPISRIRKTAGLLAKGDYAAKTGMNKNGEIGELAKTVDVLSEKLYTNEKMREDFFANVSHELRTPITVIRGYTETLADGIVTEPEKIKHTFERMLKECSGMERLVGDLLTLSKMENADFVLDKETVSLVQIFEDVVKSASVLCNKKNITINFATNDEYCFMLGDYDRLRQLFMIIIDNAIKFSKEDSAIDINLCKEEKLLISIRDYGTGIDKEMLPNIFDKFYRSKLRMNEKGSGLGLVIAKHIVDKHDGTIEADSTLGEGTTFKIIFENFEFECDTFDE